MRKASVFIHDRFAGTLEERDNGYSFSYSSDYLDQENAQALLISPYSLASVGPMAAFQSSSGSGR